MIDSNRHERLDVWLNNYMTKDKFDGLAPMADASREGTREKSHVLVTIWICPECPGRKSRTLEFNVKVFAESCMGISISNWRKEERGRHHDRRLTRWS